jgi:hypothetical protein
MPVLRVRRDWTHEHAARSALDTAIQRGEDLAQRTW